MKRKMDFAAKLDDFHAALEELQQENLLDGEVLVVQADQPLFHLQSKQVAAISRQGPPLYMIGSITKQFYAAALLKTLYQSALGTEEQKLNQVKKGLLQPLADFLGPQHPLWSGKMPKWVPSVTLHHLLSHTSGIPNYCEAKPYLCEVGHGKMFMEIPHEKAELIQLIANRPLEFAPGSKFAYSNTNYLLVSTVIETIMRQPSCEYLRTQLFEPLALSATSDISRGNYSELKNIARFALLLPEMSYNSEEDIDELYPAENFEQLGNACGTGSIISTASDLLKWNQGLHLMQMVLPRTLYQLMVTPYRECYGYGLFIDSNGAGLVYTHEGKIDTYTANVTYLAQQQISIIALTHIGNDSEQDEEEEGEEGEEEGEEYEEEEQTDTRGMEEISYLLDELLW